MANLSRGITFSSNEQMTPAKLHALIDTATAASDAFPGTPAIYNVAQSDLSASRAIHVASSPSSPATNDIAVGSDLKLDRYDGAAWVDLTTTILNLVNISSVTLVTGTAVIADPASAANCTIWSTAGTCYDVIGVSTTVCAPNATAAIQISGIAPAKIVNILGTSVGSSVRIATANASLMVSTTSVLNDVIGFVVSADAANPFEFNARIMLVR